MSNFLEICAAQRLRNVTAALATVHSILSFVIKFARARRSETRNSTEILYPISFALCLKRKSARDVCPFGKFSTVMEERFAAGNCYGGKTSTPMHFPRIQKRARYPVLRPRKCGVNRISLCARRSSAITKIDRDRRQFESRGSFIVSPVVNAQMLPILTRQRTYFFPFRFPTFTKCKSFDLRGAKRPKVFLKAIFPNIHVQWKRTLRAEKQFAYVTKLIVAHIN